MPNITICTRCAKAYEEKSEEEANSPIRKCTECYKKTGSGVSPAADSFEKETGRGFPFRGYQQRGRKPPEAGSGAAAPDK